MTLGEALARRGIRFRQSGPKIHICCLFCPSRGKPADTKFRLCVHTTDHWGRCMHCDWKHRYAIDIVLKHLGIDNITKGRDEKPRVPPPRLPDDFQLLDKPLDDLDRRARHYIRGRGISSAQIRDNNIGVSYEGRMAYRIIFPVYVGNRLVGLNGRDFTGSRTPKYLLTEGDKYLYRFDPEADTVILSEGVIKALRLARVTTYCSAALLGHALTDVQSEQIRTSKCRHVILYPDPDPAGLRGVCRIADILCARWNGQVSLVWPVPGPADEVPFAVLRKLLLTNVCHDAPLGWANYLLTHQK